jgi:hypothetical protein
MAAQTNGIVEGFLENRDVRHNQELLSRKISTERIQRSKLSVNEMSKQ